MSDHFTARPKKPQDQTTNGLLTRRLIQINSNCFLIQMRDDKISCASIECPLGVSLAMIQQSNGAV
jgi:hypothetical protein